MEATPDTKVMFDYAVPGLKAMVLLSLGDFAFHIKRNLSSEEVKLLVRLLTDDDPEPEPEPEDSEPEDSEDDGEPEDGDSKPGGGENAAPEPAGDDGDDDEWEDYADRAADGGYGGYGDDDDSEAAEEGAEPEAEGAEEDGDGPDAPAVFRGAGGEPPKREQRDYPEDILEALKMLGIDPKSI